MATPEEIRSTYKQIHDTMTKEFYPLKKAGLIDNELQAIFDISHGQNWNDMNAELIAEGYLKPYIDPLIKLEARVEQLENKT